MVRSLEILANNSRPFKHGVIYSFVIAVNDIPYDVSFDKITDYISVYNNDTHHYMRSPKKLDAIKIFVKKALGEDE